MDVLNLHGRSDRRKCDTKPHCRLATFSERSQYTLAQGCPILKALGHRVGERLVYRDVKNDLRKKPGARGGRGGIVIKKFALDRLAHHDFRGYDGEEK
jgi:hypothetical protein